MKCPVCGSELKDTDRSCMQCGAINPYNLDNKDYINKYGNKMQKEIANRGDIKRKTKPIEIIALLALVIFIAMILLYVFRLI